MGEEIILKPKNMFSEVPVVSVGEYVFEQLNKLEDKPFVIEFKTGNELTSKQIIDKSQSLAVSLLNRGIDKSDIFMCFSQNNLQYVITKFAILFLGNTLTPVKPTNGIFELKNQIRNSGTTVIFTSYLNANIVKRVLNDENNRDLRNQIKFVVVFDANFDNYLSFDQMTKEANDEKLERIPFFEVNPKEDICEIIYTSGTTGLPKGAMITHYSFVCSLVESGMMVSGGKNMSLTMSLWFPFGHISGTFLLPSSICLGNKIVIYETLNEEDILRSVQKYKINFLILSPSFGHRLLDGDLRDKYDISSVKVMTTGGSKFPIILSKRLIEKFGIVFREGYGMTEYLSPLLSDGPLGSVGSLAANTELKIIDLITGESLGPNVDGEICLKGPKLFKGYLNNESETKAAIDNKGWYRTGDIGHYDQNEYIYITDRLRELIKYKSWSVSPAEIESLLQTHESVECVAVIGVKHKTDGELPRAYVKVKDGHEVEAQNLIDYVKENMGFQQQLRGGVVLVKVIPITIVGKVDRQFFKNLIAKELLE